MPWSETSAMDQKALFIRDWLSHRHSVSELCERYNVSRKTGYKWIKRFLEHGPDGLMERSHAIHHVHNRTDPRIEMALMQLRRKHRTWGAKKLLHLLGEKEPDWDLPGRSTVCDMLTRHGMVTKRPKRRHVGHPGKPGATADAPNTLWSADFKGQFRTGDKVYCYPLTVTDNYSRYLLGCQAMPDTSLEPVKTVFTRLFKEYGLPDRIRTDNGTPFSAYTLGRLSRLSAWWVRLGVLPDLIEPGNPQQNGKHERMHKTLKDETTKPPAGNSRAQQRKFNAFIQEYNHVRPHESLDMKKPAQLYKPSTRAMPDKLPEIEYPDHYETRYVSATGGIKWKCDWFNISSVLIGEYVGLEEIDDGLWDVYYGRLKLGRLHERKGKIEDHLGRLTRMPRKV